MKLLVSVFFLSLLFCCPFKIWAQNTNAKTLLWRISGNGLSKPSYLYGTMHLYDKRIFQFGDSVYKSLENAEGYAMELDPNSMMDSILIKFNESDTTSLLEKMIDKKQYDTVAKKLEKKLGVPADHITRKMMIDARESQIYKRRNKDDMNTVVDLYLYDIARKQGKWVGGIEDVDDQSDLPEELGKNFDVNEFISEDEGEIKKELNHIIELYLSEDIDKIEEWSDGEQSPGTKDLVLTKRNIKMARRMDSLSKLRTTFFAVGAAHLPGDSGVISLLRRKGFRVDPVFSSKKIAPGNYKFSEKEFAWLRVNGPDSLYAVDMPGKPTDINKFENELKMKMYGDIVAGTFYMTGYVALDDTNNKDGIIDKIMKNFSSEEVNKTKKKYIISNGTEGVEINTIRENVYYRARIFFTGNREYMAIMGSMRHEDLFGKDADHFLQSFVMNTKTEAKNNDWVTELDSTRAFSISFPKVPEVYTLPSEKTQKNWTSTLYSVWDIKTNTYYILGVNETKKGYVMYADSIYFNERYKAILNDTATTGLEKTNFDFNGLPAMRIISNSKRSGEDIVTDFLMINKGNRNYTLVTVTEKMRKDSPNIDRFKNSFKILTSKMPEWKNRTSDNGMFSTWSPSPIDLDLADTSGLTGDDLKQALEKDKKRTQYLAYNKYSATSYNILVYPISPYYWTAGDSTFYDDETARYYVDTLSYHNFTNPGNIDSLIYSRPVKNGNITGREILVKNAGTGSYKKIRVLRAGDSVYHLLGFIPKSDLDDENNKKFFSGFEIKGSILPGHVFENKTPEILAGLSGNDSTKSANARAALHTAHFTQKDLPVLLPALVKKYSFDTSQYATTNEAIAEVIAPLVTDSVINFIREAYLSSATNNDAIKEILLELLAKHKTSASYNTLRDLFIASPPHENKYSLAFYLKDSVQLCATLFPAFEKLYEDSLSAPLIIDLSVTLYDSLLVNKKSVIDNCAAIYKIARMQISGYRRSKDYDGSFTESVIKILSILDTKESERLQNEFLSLDNIDVKQIAAICLLKNNKKVSPAEINKISSDEYHRVDFYTRLKKINKESIFPLQWHTQRLFAQAGLYNYIRDEDEMDAPLSVQFVTEKTAKLKGKLRRYFFFKAIFDVDGKKESHTAICGPFDMDKSNTEIAVDEEYEQIFYDEKFDPSRLDSQFKTYLHNTE